MYLDRIREGGDIRLFITPVSNVVLFAGLTTLETVWLVHLDECSIVFTTDLNLWWDIFNHHWSGNYIKLLAIVSSL